MKNLKSVLAVLAAMCLLLCLTVPVFATEVADTNAPADTLTTGAVADGEVNGPLPGAEEQPEDIKTPIDDPADPDAVEQIGEETEPSSGEAQDTTDATAEDAHNHEAEKPSVLRVILIVLEVIVSVALILVVLVQSGKESGLSGALSGNSDSYMSKGNRATLDKKLATMTKWVALAWIVLTVLLSVV